MLNAVKNTEDAAKRGGWMPHVMIMGILLLIMEKSWKNHGILCLNFCGNPVVSSPSNLID